MTLANSDQVTRFMLPELGIRGVAVHLADSVQRIQDRPEYTDAVKQLLGEATAATVILSNHIKVDGRLSLQFKSDGDLRTLFTESTAHGTVRGIAQLAENTPAPDVRDLTKQGSQRYLAITIENKGVGNREMQQYQGLVSVDHATLARAIEQYFDQSEQLPTRLLLAADAGHAAGIMLQKLPGSAEDQDGWDRATALFDTLKESELLELPSAEVLHSLFHEETVNLLETSSVEFACSCSRGRAWDMLVSLGPDPDLAGEPAKATDVKCEFCGQNYHFDAQEMAQIESQALSEQAGPVTLQ